MSGQTTILGPTSPELHDENARPYFLWWTDTTVGDFQRLITAEDLDTRAYWIGALLREANTRDVWLFVRPAELRALWPNLIRHLGKRRMMWAWLLGFDAPEWPPAEARKVG